MILKFALRNLSRNRRRSLLTATAIVIGAFVVGVAQAWVGGMGNMLSDNFVNYATGDLRFTTEEYVKRERFLPVDEIIPEPGPLVGALRGIAGVESVEQRFRFGILLGHADTTVQALGMGLDLKANHFNLGKKLVQGKLEDRGLYVGNQLAQKLGVKLGDELLLAGKTSEGGLNGIKLKITGIFEMGVPDLNKKVFFISLADAARLLKIPSGATEIYVFAKDRDTAEAVIPLAKALAPAGISALSYKEQMGQMYELMQSMKVVYAVVEILILFLACFVIINTMMMAVFERMREIGTLRALGMTRGEIFWGFTLEGALLGAGAGIIGALAGYAAVAALSVHGIDMRAAMDSFSGPMEYVIKPRLKISYLFIALGISVAVPALAAMIPARYSGKISPTEALKK